MKSLHHLWMVFTGTRNGSSFQVSDLNIHTVLSHCELGSYESFDEGHSLHRGYSFAATSVPIEQVMEEDKRYRFELCTPQGSQMAWLLYAQKEGMQDWSSHNLMTDDRAGSGGEKCTLWMLEILMIETPRVILCKMIFRYENAINTCIAL